MGLNTERSHERKMEKKKGEGGVRNRREGGIRGEEGIREEGKQKRVGGEKEEREME